MNIRQRLQRKFRREATAIYATPFGAAELGRYQAEFDQLDKKELTMHRNGLAQLTRYEFITKQEAWTYLSGVLAAQAQLRQRP
jgi:hypothetical protein